MEGADVFHRAGHSIGDTSPQFIHKHNRSEMVMLY